MDAMHRLSLAEPRLAGHAQRMNWSRPGRTSLRWASAQKETLWPDRWGIRAAEAKTLCLPIAVLLARLTCPCLDTPEISARAHPFSPASWRETRRIPEQFGIWPVSFLVRADSRFPMPSPHYSSWPSVRDDHSSGKPPKTLAGQTRASKPSAGSRVSVYNRARNRSQGLRSGPHPRCVVLGLSSTHHWSRSSDEVRMEF
jgi:hypothetical protein